MVTITTNALDDITEYYDNVAVKYPNTWSIEDIKEMSYKTIVVNCFQILYL